MELDIVSLYESVTEHYIYNRKEFEKLDLSKFGLTVEEFNLLYQGLFGSDKYIIVDNHYTEFYGYNKDELIRHIINTITEDDVFPTDYFSIAELYGEIILKDKEYRIDNEEGFIIIGNEYISESKLITWYDDNYDSIIEYVLNKYFDYDYVDQNITNEIGD